MTTPQTPRTKVFISYRREDSAGHVGRLHDALVKELGPDCVFMDIDSIAPGADFVQVLHYSLLQAAVVIVVMGTRWAGPKPDGTRRIDDESDFVRIEVGKALADPAVRVIPVLINRAEMLTESALPDSLKPLARRNAIEVSDTRWAHDTKLLADEIAKTSVEPGSAAPLPKSVKLIAAAVVAALVLFVWKPWEGSTFDSSSIANNAGNYAATNPGRIPKPADMKLPVNLLSDARSLLRKVNREWKQDAFVDEIYTDCRSGQCETKVFFVSPEQMQGLTASRGNPDDQWRFVNATGAVTWGSDPLPLNVMDLDDALAKAREYGMVGTIATATLTYRYPRGQTLLMWLVVPKIYRTGGQNGFCFDARSGLQYDCNRLRS